MEDEFIKKLKEKYEKGDISKEVYEDILRRYLDEKEKVQEESEKSYVGSEEGVDNGADRAMEDAMKSASSAMMDVEMETKMENRSYKCAGSCTLPPGVYDYISVAGSLKVEGDIVAKKISVAGSGYRLFCQHRAAALQFERRLLLRRRSGPAESAPATGCG